MPPVVPGCPPAAASAAPSAGTASRAQRAALLTAAAAALPVCRAGTPAGNAAAAVPLLRILLPGAPPSGSQAPCPEACSDGHNPVAAAAAAAGSEA
jgi:hypothetical protein